MIFSQSLVHHNVKPSMESQYIFLYTYQCQQDKLHIQGEHARVQGTSY